MSNEEKRKILKDEGTPVHKITFIDMYGVAIVIGLVIGIFIAVKTNSIGWGIILSIPVIVVFMFIKGIVNATTNNKVIGLSITFKCVHCNKDLTANIPSQRMTCIYCKKDNGYFDGKVYKITKENEECFQTDEEKTVKLLKKQDNEANNKSNLEQLKELKELLDMDAITQEEYDKKKTELLK